jgi:iron complex outermembrane recepter protein
MRQLLRTTLLALIFATLTLATLSAQRTVQGRVISSSSNEPLPDASVQVKGTLVGTTTDADGRFSMYVPAGATSLVFNFTGYVSQEVPIGTKTVINVSLSEGLELENVTVIGSRNATRTKLETPVPVDIIPISIIINEVGQVDLNQILSYAAPSFQSNRQTIADGTDHIDPAQLRGLGPDQVLVLVNGKRRHQSALVNINGTIGRGSVGTDLNAIPASSIERVEILRDGAAAQYGSDAIAGIINIVLKKETDVLSANVTNGANTFGDGKITTAAVNYGFKLLERGFVSVTGEFVDRTATNRMKEYTGPIFTTASTETTYRNNIVPSLGSRTGEQFDNDTLAKLGINRSAFNNRFGNSAVRNGGIFYNMMYPLSTATEFYSFGGFGTKTGEAAGFYRYPSNINATKGIYPLGFLPEIHTTILDKAATFGLRGTLKNWHFDLSQTFGQNTLNYRVENSLNATLLNASPTSFNAGGFGVKQNTINFDASRLFGNIMSGLNVAFGGEYRTDNYEIVAGEEASYRNYGLIDIIDTLRNGAGTPILTNGQITLVNSGKTRDISGGRAGGSQVFPGFRPENVVNQTRSNIAGYADIELDLSEKFLIETALRYEDYSDFGETFNYKIASRYKINNNFAVRGAVSTGFRAPSQQQKYFNNTSTQFINGTPFEIGTFTNNSRAAQLLGIPRLRQETSRNYSIGITTRPVIGMEISADAYQVDIKDRIVLTGQFSASTGEVADLLKLANASRAAFFSNAVDTRARGVDVVISYEKKTEIGDFKFGFAVNANQNNVVDSAGTTSPFIKASDILIKNNLVRTYFNREDESRFEVANPQLKAGLTVNYKRKKWGAMLRNVYFGQVKYVDPNPNPVLNFVTKELESLDQTFGAKVITDLTLSYQLTTNINLTIGGNNILNVYPDKQTHSENVSYGRFPYSRRVQQFGFNGAYYFGRLVFNLR